MYIVKTPENSVFTELFGRWAELRERFLSRYLGSVKALAEKQEAEQAKKSEIDDVIEKMLSDGVSADDILAKLK